MRKGLATVTLLTPWMIWKHRDECVFDTAEPSVQSLLDKIKDEARLWVTAGAKGLRDVWPTTWNVH
jgi:nuclear pore complex protein Nup210